mmetsp:Transcript_27775/g.86629  ORF Transcript_27775/g.86629 Transcript_27775/m.86629 type:complete len:293 (+) Transcript_27775:109-987(+)
MGAEHTQNTVRLKMALASSDNANRCAGVRARGSSGSSGNQPLGVFALAVNILDCFFAKEMSEHRPSTSSVLVTFVSFFTSSAVEAGLLPFRSPGLCSSMRIGTPGLHSPAAIAFRRESTVPTLTNTGTSSSDCSAWAMIEQKVSPTGVFCNLRWSKQDQRVPDVPPLLEPILQRKGDFFTVLQIECEALVSVQVLETCERSPLITFGEALDGMLAGVLVLDGGENVVVGLHDDALARAPHIFVSVFGFGDLAFDVLAGLGTPIHLDLGNRNLLHIADAEGLTHAEPCHLEGS